MRVVLENGATLEISPGHPTADGLPFDELAPRLAHVYTRSSPGAATNARSRD